MPEGTTTTVSESNGSYTLYNQNNKTVTLTFPTPPEAGFTVVIKDIPATNNGLPAGYTWLVNFGVKNKAGNYLPSVTYHLQGSVGHNWVIYYGDDPDPAKNVHAMNGTHNNAPGDPPVGLG